MLTKPLFKTMHMANLTFATWKTCLLPALASGLHSLANRIIHYHIQWGKFFLAKTMLTNHPTKSILSYVL